MEAFEFAVLPIGYSKDKIKVRGTKRRNAFSDVAYCEQWGKPFV